MNQLEKIILRSFRPVKIRSTSSGNELNFPCPICSHQSFSFNSRKLVGQCFRASCHWSPTLSMLRPYLRGSIIVSDERSLIEGCTDTEELEISLPGEPLIFMKNRVYYTRNYKAMLEVAKRGVPIEDQFIFGLTVSEDRVYIPVYDSGNLVNYVGRLFWWLPFASKQRYTYAPGAKTSDYLLGWDGAHTWERLGLVENSFNGIWLRKYQVTTNFGSSLSNAQINRILLGNAKSVILLWDEGAESNAERAVNKIKALGIPSCYIKIKGQPDDHPEDKIKYWIDKAHEIAHKGHSIFLDTNNP